MSLFAEMKYDELNVYIRALRHVITKLTAEHKAETDETKQAALLVQIEAKKTEFKEALEQFFNLPVPEGAPDASNYAKTVSGDTNRRTLTQKVSNVTEFKGEGPKSLHAFLSKLDQIEELYVKKNPSLAEPFVDLVKGQLDNCVYQTMKASNTNVDTYDNLKTWLQSTYDSKITNFQLLGECFNFQFDKSDNYVDQAQKFEVSLRAAESHIMAQHKKKHNSEMTASQMLHLVGAQLLSEHLRKTDLNVFRTMVTIMDDFSSATEVAAKADTMRDRLGNQAIAESAAFPTNRFSNEKPNNGNNNRHSNRNGNGRNRSHDNSNGNRYGGNRNQGGNSGYRDNRSGDNRPYRNNDNNRNQNSNRNRYDNRNGNRSDNRNNNHDGNRYENRDNRRYNGPRHDGYRGNQGSNRNSNQNQNRNQNNRTYNAERDQSPARARSRSPSNYSDRGYSPRLSKAVFRL